MPRSHRYLHIEPALCPELRESLATLIGKTIASFEINLHTLADEWDGDYEHYESYREQLTLTATDGTEVSIWSSDSEGYSSSLQAKDPCDDDD